MYHPTSIYLINNIKCKYEDSYTCLSTRSSLGIIPLEGQSEDGTSERKILT